MLVLSPYVGVRVKRDRVVPVPGAGTGLMRDEAATAWTD